MRSAADTATEAHIVRSGGMRQRLQKVTQDLHRSAERHFALDGPIRNLNDYRTLLETLWGFHVPLERKLLQLDWRGCGILMPLRRKVHWLRSDLLHLGMKTEAIAQLTQCDTLPPLESVAAGLGALYVLEGSTLGGQVILKFLRSRLAIAPDAGGRFFASYGAQIGVMWRDYLAVLERVAMELPVADAIEQSALDVFLAFDGWFEKCAGGAKKAAGADV